jgi:hypothetical protein
MVIQEARKLLRSQAKAHIIRLTASQWEDEIMWVQIVTKEMRRTSVPASNELSQQFCCELTSALQDCSLHPVLQKLCSHDTFFLFR